MEILLWLMPSVVVTLVAMAWVGWIGRDRPERGQTKVEQERFAAAIRKPLPATARPRPGVEARRMPRERSTGVAVRRTQPGAAGGDTRRSA